VVEDFSIRAARERGERVPERWEDCDCSIPHFLPGTAWWETMRDRYPELEDSELDLMLDSLHSDYHNHQRLVKSVNALVGPPKVGRPVDRSKVLPGESPEDRKRRLTRERVQRHRERNANVTL
jgi:hypothetical protein